VQQGSLASLLEEVHGFFETPHDSPPDCVMAITVYLDETQHSVPQDYAFVAGFRGTEEQWNKCVTAWKSALGKRPALHMCDLRWGGVHAEHRVKPLLERLGPIPYECGLIPVYGGVRVSDYYDLMADETIFKQKVMGYMVCLAAAFTLLMETVPGHESIKIVCEAQEEYEISAKRLFKIFRHLAGQNPSHPYLSSIEYVEKNTLLEPADYLAFALGKHFNEEGSKKDLWCRPIHGERFQLPSRPGYWLTAEGARKTFQMIMENVRSNAQQGKAPTGIGA
jgi:hypothetical protein